MMLKQSPSRNQRSKGFKVKHALQICVLFAICIWLLYQVKHSHDKKKPYEESSLKLSEKLQSGHDILQLGRKGIRPRVEEMDSDNGKRGEEEEEEEIKIEENEDDGRGGGDDEIDGRDQARAEEEEYEQGEDLIDVQDEEREEGSEEQEIEEKENHVGGGGLPEDQDNDKVETNSQDAREEHKRDDASSAVVHNTQTTNTETEKIRLRKVKEEGQAENAEMNESEQKNLTGGIEEVNYNEKDLGQLMGEDEETTEKSALGNAAGSEERGNEFNLRETDVGLDPNSSKKAVSNEEPELNSSSTLMQEETHGSLSITDILPESLQDQNVTSNEILSNRQNRSAENEQSDLDATDGTEESSVSTTNNDIVDAVQNESFDSSDSSLYQVDRDDQADLVTLPEIEIGTSNSEDADE